MKKRQQVFRLAPVRRKRKTPPTVLLVRKEKKTAQALTALEKIVDEGGKFCVKSEDGSKSFGCYDTRPEAEKRLGQIEFFKREEAMREYPDHYTVDVEPREMFEADSLHTVNIGKGIDMTMGLNTASGAVEPAGLIFHKMIFYSLGEVLNWLLYNDMQNTFLLAHEKYKTAKQPASEKNFRIVESSISLRAAEKDANGHHVFDAVLIAEGFSLNLAPENNLPVEYPREFLSDKTTLSAFEGALAKMYALEGIDKLDEQALGHLPRTLREKYDSFPLNTVGFYSDVHFGEFTTLEGKPSHGILAKFHCLNDKLGDIMAKALGAGKKDIVGFSIDADLAGVVMKAGERLWNQVKRLLSLKEVTVVDKPAAGGIPLRIAEQLRNGGLTMPFTDEQKAELGGVIAPLVAQGVAAALATRQENEMKVQESRTKLRTALEEKKLPDYIVASALDEYGEKILTDAEISRIALKRSEAWEKVPKVITPGSGEVTITKEVEDKFSDAMYALIAGKAEHNKTPAFLTLHESFYHITGSKHLSPRAIARQLMTDINFSTTHKGMSQADFSQRNRELRLVSQQNILTTTVWGQVFADTLHRVVVDNFQTNAWTGWQDLVSVISSPTDFRPMHRVRLGGFMDYEDVPEAGPYQTITWPEDDEEAFSVGKKGNIYPLTEESLRNDDILAIQQIVRGISYAGARSLYKTVFGLIESNPIMADGFALFSAQHANTHAVALSPTSLTSAILLLHNQVERGSGERIGDVEPYFLFHPNELNTEAWEDTQSLVSKTSGRTETVPNIFQSKYGLQPRRVSTWLDVNDWLLTANPQVRPMLEVAFLDGMREPEVLLANQQLVGSSFTNDVHQYKARLIFGVVALDWKAMVKAIVA